MPTSLFGERVSESVGGPAPFILTVIPNAVGGLIADLPQMDSRTAAAGDESMAERMSTWTVAHWAWRVSWCPFGGLFIGCISRSRTIRQFVAGVLLIAIFFVTGADFASIVMRELSEKGAHEPTRKLVVSWGVATGAVVVVMLRARLAETVLADTVEAAIDRHDGEPSGLRTVGHPSSSRAPRRPPLTRLISRCPAPAPGLSA